MSPQKKLFILLTDLYLSSVMSSQPSITLGRTFNLYSSRSSLNFFSGSSVWHFFLYQKELCTLYCFDQFFPLLMNKHHLYLPVFHGKCPRLFLHFLTPSLVILINTCSLRYLWQQTHHRTFPIMMFHLYIMSYHFHPQAILIVFALLPLFGLKFYLHFVVKEHSQLIFQLI